MANDDDRTDWIAAALVVVFVVGLVIAGVGLWLGVLDALHGLGQR